MTKPADALYRTEPTPWHVAINVLGVPVEFASNSESMRNAIRSSFGRWSHCRRDPNAPQVRARFYVHDRTEGAGRGAVTYRMPDDRRVLIHTPGSLALCDPDRAEIVAYVSPDLLEDRDHFRYTMLEAATFAVVTRFDRQPFHAAALVRGDAVLLLHGPSGAGKSTLSYAALRSGIRILAEDMVYLQARPRLRVWGAPSAVHLPVEARSLFPELASLHTVLLANGKEKIAVPIAAEHAAATIPYERAGLCMIAGRTHEPTLERVTRDDVIAAVAQQREDGFDLFEETIRAPVAALAGAGGWKLTTSHDPAAALPLLHSMFDELGRIS